MDELKMSALRHLLLGREIQRGEKLEEFDSANSLLSEVAASQEFFFNWPKSRLIAEFVNCPEIASDSRPLVHRHIPKTGGTSLNAVLRQHFRIENSFVQREWQEFSSYPLSRLMRLDFVAGHFGETPAILLTHRSPLEIAIVRDPLEQVPSLYMQYLRHGLVAESCSFDDWIWSAEGEDVVVNNQSRALTLNLVTRDQEGDTRSVMSWSGTEMLLNEVRDALNSIHFLGVTSRLQDVYEDVAKYYQWQTRHPLKQLNMSEVTPSKTNSNSQRILDLTQVDQWLFETASRRLSRHQKSGKSRSASSQITA